MTGPDIHREVLDNLEDGVLAVRPETEQTGEREVERGPATGNPAEIRAGPETGKTAPVPGG